MVFAAQRLVAETGHGDAAAEHAEADHSTSIMNVDPGLMIWTVVTFVILLVVLRFTAWKPLIGALDAREQRIRDTIESADRAKQEGEALLGRYQAMLDDAKSEAQKIIEEGKSDALKLKHQITAEARNEAEEFKTRARREIELATDQAKKELWNEASQLSTVLAEKILQRSLGEADHRRLVEEVLDEYRSVGPAGSD